MAILFLGNTMSDFFADASATGLQATASTLLRDAAYAPNDIMLTVDTAGSFPISIPFNTQYADVWLHLRQRTPLFNTLSDGYWMRWFNDAAEEVARIEMDNGGFACVVYGDTTVTSPYLPETGSLTNATFDIRCEVNGTNITLSLYRDGSLLRTATAANTIGIKGGASSVELTHFDYGANADNTVRYSEIIVTSGESTLGWRLGCLEPNGVGNGVAFDGNFIELGDDDLATAAGAAAANDRVSSTVTYSGPATSAGIRAVVAKTIAARGDTGPSNMRQYLRLAATNYDGAAAALTVNNVAYMEEWAVNPNTTVAWDTADLSSIEVGIVAET